MKNFIFWTVFSLALAVPVLAYGSQASTPEALVKDLYRAHNGKHSPFFQSKNRALVDKYFTKSLADLIWNDAVNSKGEVGAIDGDPLYNAQDTDIKRFAVGRAAIKGSTATVPVTFTNFGKRVKIDFKLKKVASGWKVDNIVYGGDVGTLRSWFKSAAP